MTRNLNRRQALGAFGAVSLGGLLAACGGDDETTGEVTTSTGETSTVETKTSTQASGSEDEGRDTFNDSDGIYSESGEMTSSMQGDDARGVVTLDVQAA